MKTTKWLTLVSLSVAASACHAQYSFDWARQHNGTLNTVDYFADMVVDNDGNTFVAGSTNVNLDQSASDIILIKYGPNGTLLWQRTFDGEAHGQDTGFGLALGPDGFVYVVGRTISLFNSSDFVTLKVQASSGNLVWTRTFDGPINSIDQALAVATDDHGNVFVTGEVWNQHFQYTNGDYCTLKYDPSGALVWSQIYNGPSNQLGYSDQALNIVVDHNGDPIVSGDSPDLSNASRVATIKYRGTDGAQQWLYRSEDDALSGYHVALQVASNNDVIVGGNTQDSGLQVFLTRLTAVSGNHVWTMRDSFPHGGRLKNRACLALDSSDNMAISVTYDPDGDNSNLNYNIQTSKYRLLDGTRLWSTSYGTTTRYDGQSGDAVTTDSAGNVYVAGSDLFVPNNVMSLWKFAASDGHLLWKGTYNGPKQPDVTTRICVDPQGNILAGGITGVNVGTGDADIQIAKFAVHAMISGSVTFTDFVGAPPVSAQFEIRNAANNAVLSTQTVPINPAGAYTLTAPGSGTYVVALKLGSWLRRDRSVDTSGGDIVGADLVLINGDADHDNEVGIGDYALISSAYNSGPGGPTWNPDADLNGDQSVDIADYAILSAHYGQVGDD